MKQLLLINLLIISAIAGPYQEPNEWQVADAAWLSYQIYNGVDTMDTDSGYVFDSDESILYGAYAVWKQKYSGDCYIVMRGTNNLNDILTDLNVKELYDSEIDARVHSGVRSRTLHILNNIDEKLKVCTEDIIVTGHSLGGSIAYYLYLLYVKRHSEDWGQKEKASRFKAVLLAAPALTTKSGKENIAYFDNFVHWYKYGKDGIPFIIGKVKGSKTFLIVSLILKSIGINLAKNAYDIVQTVSYGYHHPGHMFLLTNGIKRDYRFDDPFYYNAEALSDHMDLIKSVDILTQIWNK